MKNSIVKLSAFLLFVLCFVFSAEAHGPRGIGRPAAPAGGKIKIEKPAPDLIITRVELVPLSSKYLKIIDGKIHVQVRVTYKNVGNKVATGRNGRPFIISASHEIPGGRHRNYETKIRSIRARQTISHRFFMKLSDFYSDRTILFQAFADTYYDIEERNEKNNYKSIRLKIPKYTR